MKAEGIIFVDGDDSSSSNGNGIIIWQVAPTIKNCIITENSGTKGAGVYIIGTGGLMYMVDL